MKLIGLLLVILLLPVTTPAKRAVKSRCSVVEVVDVLPPEAQLRLDDVRAVILTCTPVAGGAAFTIELPRNRWPEVWAGVDPEDKPDGLFVVRQGQRLTPLPLSKRAARGDKFP